MSCNCSPPQEFTDPRRAGSCRKCGAVLDKLLPEHITELFTAFGELLESAGEKPRDLPCPEYEAYRAHALSRARTGQDLYGELWRGIDTIPEALEELPDVANYTAAEIAKEGVHPLLMEGLRQAFLSYRSIRQYQAEKRAGLD
jgi:hypothetical protein